jgi:hypothetical protein
MDGVELVERIISLRDRTEGMADRQTLADAANALERANEDLSRLLRTNAELAETIVAEEQNLLGQGISRRS